MKTKPESALSAPQIGCYAWPVPAIESALFLAWSARGLTHALWVDARAGLAERPAEIAAQVPECAPPRACADALQAYFAGRPVELSSLALDPAGSAFQQLVWRALGRIPYGQLRSYASIAAEIGNPRATRAVGMANGRNPLAVIVPCHRVVEKNSQLGGYSSGLARKRFLLALEGVDVSGEHVLPGQLQLL
jgi:methylated-DNA-[protein]-cysteine S-methyltransferase